MKIEEAITILKKHNEWRRGAEIPMTDPKILGEAIDTVVEHYDGSFISVVESYERGFMEGKEVGEREALTWHRVADGDLPKKKGMYLVWIAEYEHPVTMLYGDCGWDNPMQDAITHWMEIPEIKEDKYGMSML